MKPNENIKAPKCDLIDEGPPDAFILMPFIILFIIFILFLEGILK